MTANRETNVFSDENLSVRKACFQKFEFCCAPIDYMLRKDLERPA